MNAHVCIVICHAISIPAPGVAATTPSSGGCSPTLKTRTG